MVACRTCEKTGADEVAGIIQAPAPARLIVGGLSTEAMVADVVVAVHYPDTGIAGILSSIPIR